MREARSPNPFVVASVFGTLAALVVFLAGPVQLSGRWLASGIVSWSTVSIVNPLEDYVWYASSLLAGVLAGGLVLAVYERRRRVTSEPSMSGAETGADVPAARLVAPIVVACTCLWFVHAAVFDLWTPIANTIDPQPLTPAGMRFDAFHEGERLAFGPAFAHLSSPFSGTFFIHGFGVDALPDVLGRSLLPSLDHIVAMRLFVVIELLLTALASVWAVLEVIRARAPDGNRGLLAIALLLYLVLSRTVYQFMLIALIELALVVRICRLRDAPESVIARHAFVTGLLLPIGAFYSYSGLITSLVVVAAAVVFDARLRVGRSGLALLAGVATGAIAIVASVGPRQTTDVLGQIAYWIRFGGAIWDRPPTLWFGPHDVLLPALVAAVAIQVALLVWIVGRRLRAPWRAWSIETRVVWILLVFAIVGSRDAVDRGGFDYGERAFAASAFGFIYIGGPSIASWVARLGRSGTTLAAAGALGFLVFEAGSSVTSLHPGADVAIPADFAAVQAAPPKLGSTDCVYSLTSEGLWYEVLDRPACTAFHHVTYGRPDEAQARIVSDLAAHPPSVVVFTDETAYGQTDILSVASTNAHVVRWVLQHYRPLVTAAGAWLWEPGAGPVIRTADEPVTSEAPPIQQGSELEVLVAGASAGATSGDALYVSIDDSSESVTAAPFLPRCGTIAARFWVPTFDLAPGAHVARLWRAGPSGQAAPMLAFGFSVEPRRTAIDLQTPFRFSAGEGSEAFVGCGS